MDCIVVCVLSKGIIIAAVGLSFDEAHDKREELQATGLYIAVSVGAVGSYFAA